MFLTISALLLDIVNSEIDPKVTEMSAASDSGDRLTQFKNKGRDANVSAAVTWPSTTSITTELRRRGASDLNV